MTNRLDYLSVYRCAYQVSAEKLLSGKKVSIAFSPCLVKSSEYLLNIYVHSCSIPYYFFLIQKQITSIYFDASHTEHNS